MRISATVGAMTTRPATVAPRAAIYIRLSEETETTTSPARQRDIATAYADSRGWDVVGEYADIDVSATHSRLDRPELNRLRADIAAGRVDVVIVWRLDRLARNVIDTLTLLQDWARAGVDFVSASEALDMTTPHGKAMATLIAVFAEMEAAAIAARTTQSINKLRTTGRFAGGVIPYGYRTAPRTDGPGRVLVVEPSEAAILREAAEHIMGGEAAYRVCIDLNRRAVPSPRSEYRRVARDGGDPSTADRGGWRVQSLRRILTGDAVLGRVTHTPGRKAGSRDAGDLLRGTDGLPVTVWEPVLTVAQVAALRSLLLPKPNAAPRPAPVARVRLLSGLLRCAHCDTRLYVATSNGRPVYTCASMKRGIDCPSPRMMADTLDAYLLAEVRDVRGGMELTRTITEAHVDVETQALLADVEAQLSDVVAAMMHDDADVPTLLARRELLQRTRGELRARETTGDTFARVVKTGRTLAQDLDAAEASGDLDALRSLVDLVVDGVTLSAMTRRSSKLDPSRLVVRWAA